MPKLTPYTTQESLFNPGHGLRNLNEEYRQWRETPAGQEFFAACLNAALEVGSGHYSIDVLTGYVRHRVFLQHRPTDGSYHFNNSFRPLLARELMATDVRLRGMFELRRRKQYHKRPMKGRAA